MQPPRTRRQKDVLDYITRYVRTNGHEPSYQQIARHLGVASKAGIARHIQSLENQGLISRRRENGSFSLQILSADAISETVCRIEWLQVPEHENPIEDWERTALSVPIFLIGSREPEDMCVYRVPDDAMIEKQICEGDVVLIEKRSYARAGDLIVAITENKNVVLRQFFRDGSNTELRSANPDHEPIIFPADKVVIQGNVRGLLRPPIYQTG